MMAHQYEILQAEFDGERAHYVIGRYRRPAPRRAFHLPEWRAGLGLIFGFALLFAFAVVTPG